MEHYYFLCGENTAETTKKIKESIECWLNSLELTALVTAFGGEIPGDLDVTERAKWLLMFSDNWDYRQKQKTKDAKTGEAARWLVNNETILPSRRKLFSKMWKNLD